MNGLISLASDPNAWAALAALAGLEIVLGIDNLVFVSVLTNSLPEPMRAPARRIGLAAALLLRLAVLSLAVFLVGLTRPVLTMMNHGFSWRDVILGGGGLFLVWKATREIHEAVDPSDELDDPPRKSPTFLSAVGQVIVLDLVFSIDSIVTAVGMTDQIPIMALAVIIAMILMLIASGPLSAFIRKNPTFVMLALGFLLMIGMTLIAEAFGVHVPKGYIYAAMGFSVFVESLNMLVRARTRSGKPE
ncbi:MAG TPA: TerC family protein [Caulobacteraceae bacterium]|nr:TerC family protein [Caulobacteraceae bacterium]